MDLITSRKMERYMKGMAKDIYKLVRIQKDIVTMVCMTHLFLPYGMTHLNQDNIVHFCRRISYAFGANGHKHRELEDIYILYDSIRRIHLIWMTI